MNSKKTPLILLAFLIALALPYLFLGTQKKELTLGIYVGNAWGVPSGASYEVPEAAIAAFEAEHPGWRVKYMSGIRQTDYAEWLAEKFLDGSEPDVFLVPTEDFYAYAQMGALKRLDTLARRDSGFDEAGYYSAALASARTADGLFALPMECVPTLMFANKTLLAREGLSLPAEDWTWEDFYRLAEHIARDTDGDGRVDQFPVYGYDWELASAGNGLTLFSADGRSSSFADSRMEETLNFLLSIDALTAGMRPTSRDADLGRVAFRPFTFAEYRTYKPYPWRIKKYGEADWDCVPLPSGPRGSGEAPMKTLLVAMSARAKNERAAFDLMKKLSLDPEIQRLILEKSPGLPVRREVVLAAADEDGLGGEINLALLSRIADRAIAPQPFRGEKGALLLAQSSIKKILEGTTPIGNALHKLQNEVNNYLEQQ